MGHYETQYDTSNQLVADLKAIEDIQEWLGGVRYKKLLRAAKEDITNGATYNQFVFGLGMFWGIEGYPVQTFWRLCGGTQQAIDEWIEKTAKEN